MMSMTMVRKMEHTTLQKRGHRLHEVSLHENIQGSDTNSMQQDADSKNTCRKQPTAPRGFQLFWVQGFSVLDFGAQAQSFIGRWLKVMLAHGLGSGLCWHLFCGICQERRGVIVELCPPPPCACNACCWRLGSL